MEIASNFPRIEAEWKPWGRLRFLSDACVFRPVTSRRKEPY
jgi:hypothetical protein